MKNDIKNVVYVIIGVFVLFVMIAASGDDSSGTSQDKDTSQIALSNLTWSEVGAIYGNESGRTEIFKKNKWKDYKGKKVRWSGQVAEIEETFGVLQMSIVMGKGHTISVGGMTVSSDLIADYSPEVLVVLKKSEKAKGIKYNVGDRIKFEGILDDWSDTIQSHVELSDGVIIED